MKTEVLVECPICRRGVWVDWDKKKNSICHRCPDLANSPPVMIPQVVPQSCEAVATLYVTREVNKK